MKRTPVKKLKGMFPKKLQFNDEKKFIDFCGSMNRNKTFYYIKNINRKEMTVEVHLKSNATYSELIDLACIISLGANKLNKHFKEIQ